MPVTATFDSNVWRPVVAPAALPKNPSARYFAALNDYVQRGILKGHLAEVIFDLEAVPVRRRPAYFGEYQPKIESQLIEERQNGEAHFRASIGPDKQNHPGNSSYWKKHLEDALALGFSILATPRIATPKSPDILPAMYASRTNEEIAAQLERYSDVFETLNILGCGITQAKSLGDRYRKDDTTWMDALDRAPEHLVKKAIAEWSDGDSVAAHISYGLDFFCTLDLAVGAGGTSVFSPRNRVFLENKYGIRFVTPEQLCSIL